MTAYAKAIAEAINEADLNGHSLYLVDFGRGIKGVVLARDPADVRDKLGPKFDTLDFVYTNLSELIVASLGAENTLDFLENNFEPRDP